MLLSKTRAPDHGVRRVVPPPVRLSMFDRAALPRVAPFLAYLSFIFIADMLGRAGFAAHDLRWLYAVKIGVVLGMLLYWRRSYTELAWVPLGARATAVAISVGLVVFLLWINLNAGWMSIGSADGFDPRNDGQIEWSLVVLRIAGAALVVPVMEELFWRSFLLRWIDAADFLRFNPRLASAKAFVITVVLFGFEHNFGCRYRCRSPLIACCTCAVQSLVVAHPRPWRDEWRAGPLDCFRWTLDLLVILPTNCLLFQDNAHVEFPAKSPCSRPCQPPGVPLMSVCVPLACSWSEAWPARRQWPL